MTTATSADMALESEIEQLLHRELPDVDLREVQIIRTSGGGMLRLVIDHPDGVNHDLCVQTTNALERGGFRDRFGIEVWSPGPEPPLRTIEHYRSAVGEHVALRVGDGSKRARSISGTLVAVEADRVEVSTTDGTQHIAFDAIRRGRVIERSEA